MKLLGWLIGHSLNGGAVPLTTFSSFSKKLTLRPSPQVRPYLAIDLSLFCYLLLFSGILLLFSLFLTSGTFLDQEAMSALPLNCPQNNSTFSSRNQFLFLLPRVIGQLLLLKFQQHIKFKTNFLCS